VKKTLLKVAAAAAIEKGEPLGPQIRSRLDRAIARRDALVAEAAGLALDVELGDGAATERQRAVSGDLGKADAEVSRLTAALQQANAVDERNENDATIAAMRAGLAELQQVCDACARAAGDLDVAAEAIVGAWRRLQAGIELIRMSVPPGCSLPRGLIDPDLPRLVKAVLHKHSKISGLGQEPFPGSASPNFNATYDPAAIEPASAAIGEHVRFVLGAMNHQVALTEQFYNEEAA
jgi:hypothetical protein